MSNCVEIHNNIVIPLSQIDHNRLFEDMERINKMEKVSSGADASLNEYIIWWFLSSDNVYREKEDLVIVLGEHRSSHTERDMRQVGMVLAEYVSPSLVGVIHCPVSVSNEFDGFETRYSDEIILAKHKDQ